MIELRWIEFVPRPKLHDSGYRHIRLVGVDKDNGRHDLGEWYDHLIVEPACNIDVTADGVIRIMPWTPTKLFHFDETPLGSGTAWIQDDGRFM
jgi:hypothetical protein